MSTTTSSTRFIEPYLFFGGKCEEALKFYHTAVGAEVRMMMRFKDSPEPPQPPMPADWDNKIMHALCQIGSTSLMASDGCCGGSDGPEAFQGFSLAISVASDEEAAQVFNALADGGKIKMPLGQTFWTSSFGMLEDRFGVGWMVSVTTPES